MADCGVQFGAAAADRIQALGINRVEAAGKAGDPTGDLPHRRPSWERRQRHEGGRVDGAHRLQVLGQGFVAAGVSLLSDLTK